MNLAWLLAEFIGTFTLIFIGAGSVCLNEMMHGGVGLLGIEADVAEASARLAACLMVIDVKLMK